MQTLQENKFSRQAHKMEECAKEALAVSLGSILQALGQAQHEHEKRRVPRRARAGRAPPT